MQYKRSSVKRGWCIFLLFYYLGRPARAFSEQPKGVLMPSAFRGVLRLMNKYYIRIFVKKRISVNFDSERKCCGVD